MIKYELPDFASQLYLIIWLSVNVFLNLYYFKQTNATGKNFVMSYL